MATISTPHYLLDQARRRLTPTLNTIPGMGVLDEQLRRQHWPEFVFSEPPAGSGLKPVLGNTGLPFLGHLIEIFRGGPEYVLQMYRRYGPVYYSKSAALDAVAALGPDATQEVFSNRNKDFSTVAWQEIIGPFFDRGLLLMDSDEHMYHRRIMQEAFIRSRLSGYVKHMDSVATAVVADWPADDNRFLFMPAIKDLTLDIGAVVFMGHQPGSDHDLVTKIKAAYETTTRAGGAIIRTPLPPFKWWRGLQARKVLEEYFAERVAEKRGTEGTDMLTVLCQVADEEGNTFSDADIVNHMIFLMMAAHDTSSSTMTTMAYHLAANPEWQERLRAEGDRLIGDEPLDIDVLDKLTTFDLVVNECLRMVTPLPFNVRRAVRDTEILGHFIPAGTNINLWPGMNHRLPELWTDPERFDPERFAEPRSEHKRHRYAFAPFGGGAHKCIGLVFGQLEIKTVMHRLLRNYRLELVHPGYVPKYDFAGMPVPIDGMPIVLRPIR